MVGNGLNEKWAEMIHDGNEWVYTRRLLYQNGGNSEYLCRLCTSAINTLKIHDRNIFYSTK